MPPVRVAVVGAGQFGANHVRVVRSSPRAQLAAVVDTDPERAREAASSSAEALTDFHNLAGKVDAAVVATPTTTHAGIGCALMEAGVDVLIEKPIAPDLASADRLLETARRTGRILQVGHLERYNPAVVALEKAATLPLFFEVHRLSVFTPRSLDVDVVLDVMIHDIDIVLALVGAEPDEIRAAGISILSPKVDIANVRLQFPSGCVANLTASRVSTERVRKLRLFQPQEYLSLDYARQKVVRFRVGPNRQIDFADLPAASAEPLAVQFEAFLDSICARTGPKLDGESARRTLGVALAIIDKIEVHGKSIAETLSAQAASPRP